MSSGHEGEKRGGEGDPGYNDFGVLRVGHQEMAGVLQQTALKSKGPI